jgi:hypothetical protein
MSAQGFGLGSLNVTAAIIANATNAPQMMMGLRMSDHPHTIGTRLGGDHRTACKRIKADCHQYTLIPSAVMYALMRAET